MNGHLGTHIKISSKVDSKQVEFAVTILVKKNVYIV